jgi:rhamnulose-1-phosphate aldolase
MKDILKTTFMTEMIRTVSNMYKLGWDERNAGNISYLIDEKNVSKYLKRKSKKSFPLNFDASALAGKYFLVTGTGKYFKNIKYEPEINLGIVRIDENGKSAHLVWGFADGASPTSEFSVHLMCHISRLQANPSNKIIMHAHPANLIAMTYVHSIEEKDFSRTLWQMCIEGILVFPEGLAVLPWMLCGTNEIANSTAEKMKNFRLVVWAYHGIFGAGSSFDEAFGLIETAEKAALTHLLTADKNRKTPSDSQITALAEKWNVNYRRDWLQPE